MSPRAASVACAIGCAVAGAVACASLAPLRAQGPRAVALGVGAAPVPLHESSTGPAMSRPGLEPVRIGGEVLIGSYAGIGGFLVGRSLGGALADQMSGAAEGTRENIAHFTGVAVGGLATAGSVFAIGSIGDQTGSFGRALLGAGAGYVTGLAVRWVVVGASRSGRDSETSEMRWMGAAIESLLPAIGATIAFNASRRFK